MREKSSETTTTAPKPQKIERLRTFEKEHKEALHRAASLNIPYAVSSTEEEPSIDEKEGSSSGDGGTEVSQNMSKDAEESESKPAEGSVNWNEVLGMLFNKDESGKLQLKLDTAARS